MYRQRPAAPRRPAAPSPAAPAPATSAPARDRRGEDHSNSAHAFAPADPPARPHPRQSSPVACDTAEAGGSAARRASAAPRQWAAGVSQPKATASVGVAMSRGRSASTPDATSCASRMRVSPEVSPNQPSNGSAYFNTRAYSLSAPCEPPQPEPIHTTTREATRHRLDARDVGSLYAQLWQKRLCLRWQRKDFHTHAPLSLCQSAQADFVAAAPQARFQPPAAP